MAYLFFKSTELFRIAKDDAEKTKILNLCAGETLIEKTITTDQFNKCDYESHVYTLVDDSVVETECTEGSPADDPLEIVPPRKSKFNNSAEITQAIEAYLERINSYLINNTDVDWQAYRDALVAYTPSENVADYPKEGSLSKVLTDQGITAYNILRLP
tara:strand:+ start:464 stop:937 length:474 start_codon:yes stop_codon:yes gene_type:complete